MAIEKCGDDKGVSTVVASGELGNADTSYTYFDMSVGDWRYATIAFPTVTATTLSLEGSTNPNSTADASKSWTDVTTALTGAATATAAGAWIIDTPCAFTKMRVKRLTTNATNALNLKITRLR